MNENDREGPYVYEKFVKQREVIALAWLLFRRRFERKEYSNNLSVFVIEAFCVEVFMGHLLGHVNSSLSAV